MLVEACGRLGNHAHVLGRELENVYVSVSPPGKLEALGGGLGPGSEALTAGKEDQRRQ